MKVITEERLKEILSSRVYPEWVIEGLIRNNLKEIGAIHEENGQIIVDELRHMSDEDLLIEALDLIYEIRGAYINTKDMSYERHAKDLHELERITTLIEKRLRG